MRQLDVDFERLLLRGYSDGASYEPSSNEGTERAWLEQRAVPWWEGIAARARREQISIYCYRGTHEYAAEVSACAEVLHPHTSVPVYLTNDLNERRLSAGESMAERWRTLAASPWTVAPPHDCDLNADYERLCRDGRIVETRGRYADFEEATYGHRAMGWWAALVKQAREDRLTLCCHFFVEDTPTSRPLRHRWFSRRRTRFHFENRAYAPMAERLEERTGLTVSDAVSLLGASPWT
jgi:hypothetical protein